MNSFTALLMTLVLIGLALLGQYEPPFVYPVVPAKIEYMSTKPTPPPVSHNVTSLYQSADYNHDGRMSWKELQKFQETLVRTYSYRSNDLALSPTEFLAQGGGDCEDWAIVTCGVLKYWGYTAYVGVVDGSDGQPGSHAVALFYQTEPPLGCYQYYYADRGDLFWNIIIPVGYYLPIDYDCVGFFGPSALRGTDLRQIYNAESLYGRWM